MSILHVGHIQAAIEKRFRGLIDLSDVVYPAQVEDTQNVEIVDYH